MGEIPRNQFLDFFQVPEASLLSMIRRENQIFSVQTLPALMVLNDPADHIKQKIFFLGKLSCQHFGFSIGFEIDNNLSSQHQFI